MDADEPTRLMGYGEIGRLFGMKVESAKRLVRRKRWRRLAGNDRKVRIAVPLSALHTPDNPADHAGDERGDGTARVRRHGGADKTVDGSGDGPADNTPDAMRAIASLTAHIDRLVKELDAVKIILGATQGEGSVLRAERDALTVEITGLRATLAAVGADRDLWRAEAQRGVLARLFGRKRAA